MCCLFFPNIISLTASIKPIVVAIDGLEKYHYKLIINAPDMLFLIAYLKRFDNRFDRVTRMYQLENQVFIFD